jgi:XTP/dITP diphosphohydrolase
VIVTAASANPHKVAELATLLGSRLRVVAAAGDYRPPAETGVGYADNARIKARELFARLHGPALADDSGLEVDALGGRPGVHSARYGATAADRNQRLLEELRGRAGSARSARFHTALVLILPDGRELVAEGRCEGEIADRPRGTGGFGYDPLFLVPELGRTFGELDADEKNRLSARAFAARALLDELERAGF